MKMLLGKPVKDLILQKLKDDLAKISVIPKLVIIQVGNNPESEIYIKHKKSFGEALGVFVEHIVFGGDSSEQGLLNSINKYNNDDSVKGIIIQLPLPKTFSQRKILNSVSPVKDVDGLGLFQSGLLYTGEKNVLMPATARGIMSLLDYYGISLDGKNVCIVGRSMLVGRPLLMACLNRNATVTICHSRTKNLEEITRQADILIVAVGKPNFINSKYVKTGQTVIDVGINRIGEKICGDVDFESVKEIVSAITPVPGGVGPLTVASLFENLLAAPISTI